MAYGCVFCVHHLITPPDGMQGVWWATEGRRSAPMAARHGGALTAQASKWYGSQGFDSAERAAPRVSCTCQSAMRAKRVSTTMVEAAAATGERKLLTEVAAK